MNPEIKELIKSGKHTKMKQDFTSESEREQSQQGGKATLIDLVIMDSKKYQTKEDATKCLQQIKEVITNYQFSDSLQQLFEIGLESSSHHRSIPKLESIGKWLKDTEKEYFTKVTYEEQQYSDNDWIGLPRTRTRQVVSGFEVTTDISDYVTKVILTPKYPNIQRYNFTIILIFSKTDIRIFYFFTTYKETDWNKWVLNDNFEWKTVEINFDDVTRGGQIMSIMSQFDTWVKTKIEELIKHVEPKS